MKGLLNFWRSRMQKPSCFAVTLKYSCEHHKDEEHDIFQRQQKKNKIFPIFWAQSGIIEVCRTPDWNQIHAAASLSCSHSLIPVLYSHNPPCTAMPLQVNNPSCKISWETSQKKNKKWKDKVLDSMNKLNQSMQEALKRSTRSKRAETMDGRKHNVMEREAFYLPGIIRSAQLYCLH